MRESFTYKYIFIFNYDSDVENKINKEIKPIEKLRICLKKIHFFFSLTNTICLLCCDFRIHCASQITIYTVLWKFVLQLTHIIFHFKWNIKWMKTKNSNVYFDAILINQLCNEAQIFWQMKKKKKKNNQFTPTIFHYKHFVIINTFRLVNRKKTELEQLANGICFFFFYFGQYRILGVWVFCAQVHTHTTTQHFIQFSKKRIWCSPYWLIIIIHLLNVMSVAFFLKQIHLLLTEAFYSSNSNSLWNLRNRMHFIC